MGTGVGETVGAGAGMGVGAGLGTGVGGAVGAGAIAGVIAQTFVYPMDVIRRRNQTHGGDKELYKNTWDAIKVIYREEGLRRGLYKGLSLNYLKTAPNTALYLSLYDFFKSYSFNQRV